MWLRTRRSGVRISQGAPLLESKGFNQSELHPDRLGNTRRSSMSSSHKYFFILQNQHVTDANVSSFYGPQKLLRKRHTLRGPTSTWWHRSHPAQWSRARNLSSSAMLATVAARCVPMGSSRRRGHVFLKGQTLFATRILNGTWEQCGVENDWGAC